MGKQLAIKGHATRGKEVIELFKMMGAKHFVLDGTHDWYVINDLDNSITFYDHNYINCHEFVKFTLEEFLEKYPFKVGDKVVDCYGNPVTIKSMKWSEDFETMVYDFEETEDVLCAEDIESVNDNHTKPSKMKNVLAELLEHIKTTPKEDLEREFEEIKEWSNVGPTVEEFRTFCECVNKKPIYPDNYEECVRIAKNIHGYDINIDAPAYRGEAELFIKLLICRDAYWKIYGEEKGLGKPWKPNETSINAQYGIRPLLFPSKEIYNIFYDNFKDLIEQCKELL